MYAHTMLNVRVDMGKLHCGMQTQQWNNGIVKNVTQNRASQSCNNRARKSRTTLQNKVRLKVLPEQLTLSVNTSVTLKRCIIQ